MSDITPIAEKLEKIDADMELILNSYIFRTPHLLKVPHDVIFLNENPNPPAMLGRIV